MSIRSYKKNKGWLYRSRKNKKNQQKFRSNLSKTTRGEWEHKSEEQKNTINKLRMFYKAREKLLHCLMIIPQLYVKLNIKQNMEKDSKYQLLNKCFKDC